MQLGEPLLAAAGALPGAPFYPLEGGGRGGGAGAGAGAGGGSRGPPRPGSPPRLDLDKTPKKFAAAPAMLGEAEAGEPPFAAPKPDGRKATPCGEEELPSAAARYSMDSLSPERYYLQSPGPPGAELGGPCALFPYPPAAQHGTVYQPPGGPRYPYGSYGQAAAGGTLYGPYPAASGSCGGLGALGVPAAGAGLRAQVFLCNRPLWLKFHRHQTEMIITKQGR
uniref:T-box domain-containing protein n=1 Tax=Aquila chrysaetos chrysaetos TaxID=223781 RepID=A0A663EDP8_AQUCH